MLSERIIDVIEEADYNVIHGNGNEYTFQKYSPAGQHFSITVDTGNNLNEFTYNIYQLWESFDCSYETYLWLDNTGHGINGAPSDMKEIYEDMEICKQYILDLHNIVIAYVCENGAENEKQSG